MRRAGIALGAALVLCACSDASPFGGPHGGDGRKVQPTMGWVPGTTYEAPDPPPPPAGGEPGTWYHIYSGKFAAGTEGDCVRCHAETKTSKATYQWLKELEYIGTDPPPLIDYGASCLTWFGGNMPPWAVEPNEAFIAEMNTWAANGAKED